MPGDDGLGGTTAAVSARARYLEHARRLARGTYEPARHFAVSHVTIGTVAAAAGVSRAALYRLWPSQQEFWTELIDVLATDDLEAIPDEATLTTEGDGTLLDIVQHDVLHDPLPLVRTAIVSYPDRPQLVAETRELQTALLREHIERRLRAHRRRCVAGVDVMDLALAAAGLGHGVAFTGRMCAPVELQIGPLGSGSDVRGPRSLLGVATANVTRLLTEPTAVGPRLAHHRSLRELRMAAASQAARPTGRRREYLSIAAHLATTDAGLNHALGHIDLARVARTAGVTARSLTKVWPDGSAFRIDLLRHMLAADRAALIAEVTEATARTARSATEPAAAFRALGEGVHDHIRQRLEGTSLLAFAPLLADRRALTVASAVQHRYLDACAEQLHALLHVVQRATRPRVTARQLALLLSVIADGLERLARTDPAVLRDDINTADGPASLTALIVETLLGALTEDAPTGVLATAAGQYARLVS